MVVLVTLDNTNHVHAPLTAAAPIVKEVLFVFVFIYMIALLHYKKSTAQSNHVRAAAPFGLRALVATSSPCQIHVQLKGRKKQVGGPVADFNDL
jgi:hypothetical protein